MRHLVEQVASVAQTAVPGIDLDERVGAEGAVEVDARFDNVRVELLGEH